MYNSFDKMDSTSMRKQKGLCGVSEGEGEVDAEEEEEKKKGRRASWKYDGGQAVDECTAVNDRKYKVESAARALNDGKLRG